MVVQGRIRCCPKAKGLNRFVWDMRYATMPGVPGVRIEGSYAGHKAPPGKYIDHVENGWTDALDRS